jgi:hypothetical protein
MSKLISFSKSVIDDICKKSSTVGDAFIAFYKIAIPEFDKVKQINGFPVVSESTATYCIDKLQEKTDNAWEVNGLWLDKGFFSDKSVPDWKISTEKVQLTF